VVGILRNIGGGGQIWITTMLLVYICGLHSLISIGLDRAFAVQMKPPPQIYSDVADMLEKVLKVSGDL
jgi:hypothetical protein